MSIKNLVEKAAMLDFLVKKGNITIPVVEQLAVEERDEFSSFVVENQKEVFHIDKEDGSNPLWAISSFFKTFYEAEPSRIAFVDYWDAYELDNLLPDNIEEVEDSFMIAFLNYPEEIIEEYKQDFLKKLVKDYDCNNPYDYDTTQKLFNEYIAERFHEKE